MAPPLYSNAKRRRISPNMETDETCNMEWDSWPLHDAAARNDCNTIRKLVFDGWYLDQLNNMSETPLHLAVRERQYSAIKLLVELAADCDIPDRHGKRPLEVAIDRADPELVKILTRHAKVSYIDLAQAFNEDLVEIMNILLTADKSLIDERDENGNSLLMISVMRRDHAFVCLLIRHGCNVNVLNKEKYTPLHQAVLLNCSYMTETLLEAGGNALLLSSTHRSTVHLALLNENDDMVKLLLKYEKKKSIQYRQQILRVAVKSTNVDFSKAIVEHFQDAWTSDVINERDSEGNSPLLSASFAGHHFAVNVLLERGADINFRNRDEHDALYLAVWSGHPETIEIILTKAIDRRFNRRQNVTQSPNMIFLAIAMELSGEIIESLLKHALDEELYEMNESNRNILHQALQYERKDVVELIKTYCSINRLIYGNDSSRQLLISICDEKSYFDVMLFLFPNEFNEIADDILLRDINEKNVERIKSILEIGVYINESHIEASIDLESSKYYEIYNMNYELKEEDTLEDSILGILIGNNSILHKKASYYAISKMKYKVVHRLHFKKYLTEPTNLEGPMINFIYSLNSTYEEIEDDFSCGSIHEAIEYNIVVFIVEFFQYWSMELNFDEIGPTDETPLQKAIRLRNVEAAAVLIQHGAKVQMSEQELLKCQRIFGKPFYNLLIEAGAEKKQCTRSLLQLCRIALRQNMYTFCLARNIEICYDVIQYNYKYNIDAIYCGDTALSYAIKLNGKYRSEIVRELLIEGANPRKLDKDGKTPLVIACANPNNLGIIDMLSTVAPDVVNTSDRYGMTALHYAAKNDDGDCIEALIEAGSNLNRVDNNGDSALHRACAEGNDVNIKILVNNDANVRQLNNKGQTPLMIAASTYGINITTIDMLIAAALDVVNALDCNEMTALLYAAENTDSCKLRALIEAGSDLNHVNNNGDSALHRACAEGNDVNIEILVNNDANVRQLNNKGQTPLMIAASTYGINITTIDMLIATAPDVVNALDCNEMTALLYAAENIDSGCLEALIKSESNIFHVNDNGDSALHRACAKGRNINIEILLQHKADAQQLNNKGQTPLIIAASNPKIDISTINILIAAAPDVVNIPDRVGMTALLYAAENIYIYKLRALIDAGSDINHVNNSDNGAFHRASAKGVYANIELLLEHEGNVRQLNKKGQTPLHIATSTYGINITTVNMLVAAAPDVVNTADCYGTTSLMYAAENFNSGHIKALINAGSFLNHVNNNGDSALHRACAEGNNGNIRMLLRHGANVRQLNNKGQTPLMIAASTYGIKKTIINSLIAVAPDLVNISDCSGMTALLYAAENTDSGCLEALIDSESDVYHVNHNGDNALHRACAEGRNTNIEILLQHKANAQQVNNKGQTPLIVAASNPSINNSTINILIAVASDVVNITDKEGMTALLNAAENIDIYKLKALMEAGSDVNHVNYNGDSALHRACANGGNESIKMLLQHGANGGQPNNNCETSLLLAASNPEVNIYIINMIIAAAPNVVDISDRDGNTALLYAAENIDSRYLEALIKAGSDLNLVDNSGNSALHRACAKGRDTNIEILLQHKANVRQLNNKGQTPLMVAASTYGINITTIIFLIAAAPDVVNTSDCNGMTALLYAAKNTESGCLEALIESETDVYHVNDNGDSVLHMACANGNNGNILLLLLRGANVRQLNNKWQTPLMVAASTYGINITTIDMLIVAAPDVVNISDCDGMTALLYAAENTDSGCLEALIESESDVYHVNVDGDSALHRACAKGRNTNIEMLLQNQADARQLNNKGQTPLIVAASNPTINISTINMLVATAPDVVNTADREGMTALLYATESMYSYKLRALIEAGCDVNRVNNDGDSALHRACADGGNEIIRMLLRYGADVRQLNNKGETPLMVTVSNPEINTSTINMLQAAVPDVEDVLFDNNHN